jgi:hypothetical protein
MFARRIKETLGLLMIGDGALCLAYPQKHTQPWSGGPAILQKAMQPFVHNPALTRSLGLISIGFGLWMAGRQYSPRSIARMAGHRMRAMIGA